MSLIVANFRDVGESVNILSDRRIMKEGVLLRGGKIDMVENVESIHSPKTIVNLRKGNDPSFDHVRNIKLPAADSVDVYSVESGKNRKWLVSVLGALTDSSTEAPYYVHCAAGKDRTGVVVGAILASLGIDREIIVEEYESSVGLLQPGLFREAVDRFFETDYFRKVDTSALRKLFLLDI